MRRYWVLLLVLCFSCGKEVVEKPEDLIPEAKMEAILYDLMLLDAISSNDNTRLKKLGKSRDRFIYEAYSIDSAQFMRSNIYYAADPEKLSQMYERIQMRFEKQTDSVSEVMQMEVKKRDSIKESKRTVVDSTKLKADRPNRGN